MDNEKIIVLLASRGTGVGKSYLAKALLEDFKETSQLLSFAGSIRKDIASILDNKNISGRQFTQIEYNAIKNIPTNLGIGYNVILRNLICDYSDLVQKHFGETIWAELLCNSLYYPITIIDDWRREVESNYLITYSGAKVIKVYLEKEGITGATGNSYENMINPDTCDFHFILDETRSNFLDVKNEIIKALNKA